MDMRAIQMNEQLEPTAEEAAVYEILDAMKPGDWFYLPDGASGADAVFVVAAGQSRGLNLASQAERRFLVGGTRWRITRLPDGVAGKSQGTVVEFLAAYADAWSGYTVSVAELWEAYREAYPGSTLGKTTFGRTLDRLGYPSVKRGNRMVRVGLRLKPRPITREEIGLKTE